MIIFGTTTTKKKLRTGHFDCPQCGQHAEYRELRPKSWGHLYWIPLIPLKEYPPFVECRSCRASFVPAVLDHAEQNQRFMAQFERACLQVAAKMALADGHVDESERTQIAEMMTGITRQEYTLDQVNAEIAAVEAADQTIEELVREIAPSLSDQGREMVLLALIEVALADGEFAREEADLARSCGKALGMSPAHVRGIIAEAEDRAEETVAA